MASDGWGTLSFGELTENFDSIRVPVKQADRRPGPYPYYGASGVVDRVDGYLFDGDYLLVAEDGENLRTRQTPIAFMATGKFWVNNHAHIVRGNGKATTRFLEYAMSRTDISGYLTGSTMPKLTQGNMNRIPVLTPPRPVQDGIVSILGTLDDKIELNRQMNETLETTARAVFKSWFVDFDPVRAKMDGQKPLGMDEDTARLFPASFEGSALGKTPRGWHCGRWGDLATLEYGKGLRGYRDRTGGCRVFGTNGPVGWHDEPLCPIAGIIIGRKGAYRGVHYSPEPFFVIDTAFYLAPKTDVDLKWAYYELLNFDLNSMDSGSAIPSTSREDFYGIPVCIPVHPVQHRFGEILETWFAQKYANERQSQTLAKLRDTLLPKLLSGEIRVAEAEKLAEEVA